LSPAALSNRRTITAAAERQRPPPSPPVVKDRRHSGLFTRRFDPCRHHARQQQKPRFISAQRRDRVARCHVTTNFRRRRSVCHYSIIGVPKRLFRCRMCVYARNHSSPLLEPMRRITIRNGVKRVKLLILNLGHTGNFCFNCFIRLYRIKVRHVVLIRTNLYLT